ncbi:MAG: DUF2919 domain-containing protein [Vibrio sp.]
MKYELEDYDKNGFLKPNIWLYLGWFLLAKAWVVFVVASASRTMSSQLLEIIYPVQNSLYLGLAVGFPTLILVWAVSLRTPERKWLNRFISFGRAYTIGLVLIQCSLTIYHLVQLQWLFNWSDALTLLGLMWLFLYLLRSQRVKDTFSIPQFR